MWASILTFLNSLLAFMIPIEKAVIKTPAEKADSDMADLDGHEQATKESGRPS